MNKFPLHHLYGIAIATLCIVTLPPQAQAAPKGKAKTTQQAQKERLVLLPMDISEENRAMYGQQESAVVAGLAQKYEVFSGDRVIQELRKASSKENARAKGPCDETRCLEDVAIALQTENVAMVHVTKMEGGYLLSISIKNVMTNQAIFDNSLPCEGCNIFRVIDKLKELVGTSAAIATAPALVDEAPPAKVNLSDPETALWEEAKKGNAAEDYQAYLSTYPKGKYAPLAKTKLARIKDEAKAETEKQEQQAWDDALQSASQESYSAYLNTYPKGRFAALAQGRIAKLKKEESDAEVKQRREQLAKEAKQKREQVAAAKNAAQGPAMVRISDAYQVKSAPSNLLINSLKLLHPERFSIDKISKLIHEKDWPEDINAFEKRSKDPHPMNGLVGYVVATLEDDFVIFVPQTENRGATFNLSKDIFVLIEKSGIAPR